ncbi:MAG TPA: hypothetical protein VFR90_12110 [Methylibium sp.]|uniref:hypothetical protein n=1 Tax=Methylibium sp. TaxID=2067992 RepID=UPI002DB5DD22|nr:hypothetical protein [Methylibium sp.]HEU4459859.1 hypothetical protein [Methylibium sp.]
MRRSGWVVVAFAALLGGCAEKAQTSGSKKVDQQSHAGTGQAAFTAPGWKPGDEASWEQQIRARAQAQNEYVRTR